MAMPTFLFRPASMLVTVAPSIAESSSPSNPRGITSIETATNAASCGCLSAVNSVARFGCRIVAAMGGNAGLIMNGGNIDTGDDAVFPLTGIMLVQADSTITCGDGTQFPRGWQFGAQIRGSAALQVTSNAGVTNGRRHLHLARLSSLSTRTTHKEFSMLLALITWLTLNMTLTIVT